MKVCILHTFNLVLHEQLVHTHCSLLPPQHHDWHHSLHFKLSKPKTPTTTTKPRPPHTTQIPICSSAPQVYQQPLHFQISRLQSKPKPRFRIPKSETHQNSQQTHFEEDYSRSLDQVYHHHVNRTKSDTNPASGELPEKLPGKIRKSASAKSTFAHFEEDEIVEARRPATVKEGRVSTEAVEDEQVDAKADDFINRFKQHLKLQRLDSIIRYKDMISRGGAK
ncbi:Pathogen-associated molecular patterns-induced protein A70 [Camellia lanceoleosa]|uniref:Pathogen-associated molecular patterns-induced protein A70 n=1 Tax=Camellia lanceoleosa TaxID=1840588 RepID=A0ACC0FZX9_9ERIC|nr:Pathogen-associated molecular patterns-induced protein A70 [Camellia lanceoleosa]